jgi:plastocyanin
LNHIKQTKFISILLMALAVFAMALVACGDSEPEDRLFELSIEEGALTLDPPVMKVDQGDTVTLSVASDEHGSVHLHGYDEEFEVGPDEETVVVFEADATGSFKLTLHGAEHSEDDHGAIFDSLWLAKGESFSFDFLEDLGGKVIPFHNHMDHEISGSITVDSEPAPLAVVSIEVRDGSFVPSDISVGVGSAVIWTNVDDTQARVVSGIMMAPGEEMEEMEDDHDEEEHDEEEGDEVQLGSLEVHPR